jgi:hypothetical protein
MRVRSKNNGDQGEHAEHETRYKPGERLGAAIPFLHRNNRACNRADDAHNQHEHPARRIHQSHGNNRFGVDNYGANLWKNRQTAETALLKIFRRRLFNTETRNRLAEIGIRVRENSDMDLK